MAFETNQTAYRDFRDILKQRTQQVVLWAGAGLSRASGLPSWDQLRATLASEAEKEGALLDGEGQERTRALLSLARMETDPWLAFSHLRKALGETSYTATIRNAFQTAARVNPPASYSKLWGLGVTGVMTLNIDNFASRSFTLLKAGQALRKFDGFDSNKHGDVLKSGTPFVANLHGSLEDATSWVFTHEDFLRLQSLPGYRLLLQSIFATRTVLFVGISADDQGATKHLQTLKESGISLAEHFWLTSRNDLQTHKWAQEIGIRQIFYEKHEDLDLFFSDLKSYIPPEINPPPVTPPTEPLKENDELPDPETIERLSANEIRIQLNNEAVRILDSSDPQKLEKYNSFWNRYEEAIYRAWSVNTVPGKNALFQYKLVDTIAKGAFGIVYLAKDADDKEVAIKILRGNVKEEPQMLESFRRGVAAMKILSERNVKGMVPYIAAWEIPTCTVMEVIHGPNLEEAVRARQVGSWQMILEIAIQTVTILKEAHHLPERVLHRDVRPPNIMLKDFYIDPTEINVAVLDFDLSWHRDASGLSVDLGKSSHGYVSPEQVDAARKKLTRNALVDSFGLGMTLYYLASGKQPSPSQHMHKDWDRILDHEVGQKACAEWRCLPRRFARLVWWSTQDSQSRRWDMTRIQGELIRLRDCIRNPRRVDSVEIVAEEIAARCDRMSGIYEWNLDKASASLELKSGFTITITSDPSARMVGLCFDWNHAGDQWYKDVKKFIGPAADRACAELRSNSWKIDQKEVATGRCRITANAPMHLLQQDSALNAASTSLSKAISIFRFD